MPGEDQVMDLVCDYASALPLGLAEVGSVSEHVWGMVSGHPLDPCPCLVLAFQVSLGQCLASSCLLYSLLWVVGSVCVGYRDQVWQPQLGEPAVIHCHGCYADGGGQ